MALALPEAIQNLIQQNLLDRHYHNSLFPNQMFRRMSVVAETWEARLGETRTFTRRGILSVDTRANTPGNDPTPQMGPGMEQWTVTAAQYTKTIDTNLPSDWVSIASEFTQDAIALARQAGQTLNHIVRNKIYNAYLGGQTYVTTTAGSSLSIAVKYLNGFKVNLVDGRPAGVSSANPLAITVGGVARNVVGYTITDADLPDGAGTLVLDAAIAVTAGDAVLALNRPTIVRVGGGNTVNDVGSADLLTMASLRAGVVKLRSRNVETWPDGTFHMHASPVSLMQLFADTEFQALYQGSANHPDIKGATIAKTMGVTFIDNNECPNNLNTSNYDFIAADRVVQIGANAGVAVERPILLGFASIREKYIPKDAFVSMMNVKPIGKVGGSEVLVTDGGYSTILDRIRFIVLPPMNRLQDMVSQTWVFEGDWGIPTDSLTGDAAWFKRAIVFEHGAP